MIAIPNMEIPKTCGECELRALDEWEDEYCVILGDDILVPYERMLDCPLIDIVTCGECRHRDPEDKKCDCGMFERQGCIFPVADDYFCKYGERK